MNLDHIDKEVEKLEQEISDNEKKIILIKQSIKMNLRLIREYKTGKEAMEKANADSQQDT